MVEQAWHRHGADLRAEAFDGGAALNGFWTIPKTGIMQIGRFIGADVSCASFPELVLSVASAILGELSDEQRLAILRKRLPESTALIDALKESDVVDILPEKERQQLFETGEAAKAQQEVVEEFRKDIKKLASLRKALAGKALASSSGSAGGGDQKRLRKYPPKVQVTSNFTEQDCALVLPNGCRMYIDKLDWNWRMQAFGGKWHGRSIRLYGYEEAAGLLIKEAWTIAIDRGEGRACPFPEYGFS